MGVPVLDLAFALVALVTLGISELGKVPGTIDERVRGDEADPAAAEILAGAGAGLLANAVFGVFAELRIPGVPTSRGVFDPDAVGLLIPFVVRADGPASGASSGCDVGSCFKS